MWRDPQGRPDPRRHAARGRPCGDRRRHAALPGPAGVRRDRPNPRPGPACRRARQGRDCRQGVAAGADTAGGARRSPVRRRPDAHAARRRCHCDRLSTAHHPGQLRCRRPGAVLPGRADQCRDADRERWHEGPVQHAAPERDAAPGGRRARRVLKRRAGRVPAHGRRFRRQGIAVGTVRLHRARGLQGASAARSGATGSAPPACGSRCWRACRSAV